MAVEYVNRDLQLRNECEDSDLRKRTGLRERIGNCDTLFVTEGEQRTGNAILDTFPLWN